VSTAASFVVDANQQLWASGSAGMAWRRGNSTDQLDARIALGQQVTIRHDSRRESDSDRQIAARHGRDSVWVATMIRAVSSIVVGSGGGSRTTATRAALGLVVTSGWVPTSGGSSDAGAGLDE